MEYCPIVGNTLHRDTAYRTEKKYKIQKIHQWSTNSVSNKILFYQIKFLPVLIGFILDHIKHVIMDGSWVKHEKKISYAQIMWLEFFF